MDPLSVIGLLLGFITIIVGQMIEGGDLHSLVNFPALLIVLGGTFGAVLVQTPKPTFKRAFIILPWVIKQPNHNYDECRDYLVELSKKSRQLGLLSLEHQIEKEKNPLIQKGLELLVTGVDKVTIRQLLESDISRHEFNDINAAKVFESMGGYSPTIGILGAVLGLIQVMRNLADPSQLGLGIAVAFVATIYGVGFANLVFLPVANKLKSCVNQKVHFDEMIVEAMVGMASGESPNMLKIKLNNFGHHKKHEKQAP